MRISEEVDTAPSSGGIGLGQVWRLPPFLPGTRLLSWCFLPHPCPFLLLPHSLFKHASWTTVQKGYSLPTVTGSPLTFLVVLQSTCLYLMSYCTRTCTHTYTRVHTHSHTYFVWLLFPLQDISPVSSGLQFIYLRYPEECLVHRRCSMYLINKMASNPHSSMKWILVKIKLNNACKNHLAICPE